MQEYGLYEIGDVEQEGSLFSALVLFSILLVSTRFLWIVFFHLNKLETPAQCYTSDVCDSVRLNPLDQCEVFGQELKTHAEHKHTAVPRQQT